jgi:hypothetical protein
MPLYVWLPVGQTRQLNGYIYHRRRTLKITTIVLLYMRREIPKVTGWGRKVMGNAL